MVVLIVVLEEATELLVVIDKLGLLAAFLVWLCLGLQPTKSKARAAESKIGLIFFHQIISKFMLLKVYHNR
ncbi:hypothetical protein K5E_23820 [Enterococcus thailandicus]|nr:hypothetical protein K4E_11360 [Enterococcus thailandicus]GMC10243.1 hypothetical protein K5E_23820 [Enterococcus thailandicus]